MYQSQHAAASHKCSIHVISRRIHHKTHRLFAYLLCLSLVLSAVLPCFALDKRFFPTVPPVVESGGSNANAPSDGGRDGVSNEDLAAFLRRLSSLPHFQEIRAARYLNYYGSTRYSEEDILRIVNTDNDLEAYSVGWYSDFGKGDLIIANKYHYLDRFVPSDLVPLGWYGDSGYLQRSAYDSFVAMVDAAAENGYAIRADSPYRSYGTQESVYNGYVRRNGRSAADSYSARPGFSEHQTGLAVDIAVRGSTYHSFGSSKAFQWVSTHAHEYGFILRYGEGMRYITGYIYEPWHYRYVGVDAATYIYTHGLTFEEYYYYYVAGHEMRDD